jgi:hypothetical protein
MCLVDFDLQAALALLTAAAVLAGTGHTVGAAFLIGSLGDATATWPRDPDVYAISDVEKAIVDARAQLGEEDWQAAMDEGSRLDTAQALSRAESWLEVCVEPK